MFRFQVVEKKCRVCRKTFKTVWPRQVYCVGCKAGARKATGRALWRLWYSNEANRLLHCRRQKMRSIYCGDQIAAYQSRYREANKERVARVQHAYYMRNKKAIKAKAEIYYAEHREEINERRRLKTLATQKRKRAESGNLEPIYRKVGSRAS